MSEKSTNRGKFALVAFPLPMFQEFSYLIPEDLINMVETGSVVAAPFRRWIKTGYVTGFSDTPPPGQVKKIQDVITDIPVFNEELLKLARWMSGYYFTSLGEILQTAMPVKLNRDSVEVYSLSEAGLALSEEEIRDLHATEQKIIAALKKHEKATPKLLRQETGNRQLYYRLDRLMQAGILDYKHAQRTEKHKAKTVTFYTVFPDLMSDQIEDLLSRSPAQKQLCAFIMERGEASKPEILEIFPGKGQILKALVEKNCISAEEREVTREFDEEAQGNREELPPLTERQQVAVDEVETYAERSSFGTFLLHGVTGSGKTRVYLELIHNAIDRGEGAIFLAPEIALTNYFLASLRGQFGEKVAVLHSRMSPGERFDAWRGILSGEKRLVIGPRSAVFAPVKNLSTIIVDEEHDSSYKQHESSPYYHARNVAVYRAKVTKSRIVLGSATPSMETFSNAETGKYKLLELPSRISDTALPRVELIDMREAKKLIPDHRGAMILSPQMKMELRERLENGEQAMIMLNRRGFSTFIQCSDCGHIEMSPECNIALTYHKNQNRLVCHISGFSKKAPAQCPSCHSNELNYTGIGTQQVEDMLTEEFPDYKTTRMDQDTTRSKSAHRKIIAKFEKGEAQILLGTQMVAKGFDFENVNFVGVISADTGLFIPEFRAAERTFQLMTQTAGRAGRRKEQGLVMIQTYNPNHYSLTAAKKHDYHEFYKKECENREELDYPPFGRVTLLRFFSEDHSSVVNASADIGAFLRKAGFRNIMLGPAPAPIEKIRTMYRWLIFLRSRIKDDPNGRKIKEAAHIARFEFDQSLHKKTAAMTIDVDPVGLM